MPSPVAATSPVWLSIGLAFLGGYADCGSYVLAQTFTGHTTGNAVLAMISLAQHTWPSLLLRLLAIGCFLAGTAAGADWSRKIRSSPLVTPLFAEAGILAVSIWLLLHLHAHATSVFLAGMSLTLGLQNGALQKTKGVSVHTTFMTGMVTRILTGSENARSDEGPQLRLLLAIYFAFLGGAIVAALFTLHWKASGMWPAVLFLLALGTADLVVSGRRAA